MRIKNAKAEKPTSTRPPLKPHSSPTQFNMHRTVSERQPFFVKSKQIGQMHQCTHKSLPCPLFLFPHRLHVPQYFSHVSCCSFSVLALLTSLASSSSHSTYLYCHNNTKNHVGFLFFSSSVSLCGKNPRSFKTCATRLHSSCVIFVKCVPGESSTVSFRGSILSFCIGSFAFSSSVTGKILYSWWLGMFRAWKLVVNIRQTQTALST